MSRRTSGADRSPSAALSEQPCLLEGYFKKMGISKTNSWKKRYFRLYADPSPRLKLLHLSYFEKKESKITKPKGTITIGIGSTIRKINHPERKNCFELCAQGNIKLIASAVVGPDCEKWINEIAGRISGWGNEVLENLKPNIARRLQASDPEAAAKVAQLGPMELLRLVVVAAYHSLCVAGVFVEVSKDQVHAAQSAAAAKHSNAKLAKPVANFEAADFLRWVMDAQLVTSRENAVILGSLVLKHGWIRSAAVSKGQGKAESSAGSTFETAVGSVYHFVANFGSIIWMGWIRLQALGGVGGGGGGSSSGKAPAFEFWQLVSRLDGLVLQKLSDQASGIIVAEYAMQGFLAHDIDGDDLRFRLERRGSSSDGKMRFDIECESSTAKKYAFKAVSKTLSDLAQIKQAVALDKDTMMGLIRQKRTHDLLSLSADDAAAPGSAIPVVDAVWGEACTSTVQQLVPIFEGELFKQPKSVTKEGKKGKTIDAQVMDTAKFQSRYFRLHLDVQVQWATQYGVKGKLYKAIKAKRAKFLKKLAKKAGEAVPRDDSSDEDAFGSDEEDLSGDTCRPFAYLSYFKTSATLVPQGVIAINRRCIVERIRESVQDRSYLFKLKTDNAKTNQLVVDVGKSAGYRDRWISAISNTITVASELERDAGFLDARKRAEEVPVAGAISAIDAGGGAVAVEHDQKGSSSASPSSAALSRSGSYKISALGATSPGAVVGSDHSPAVLAATGDDDSGEVHTEWVQVLSHRSVVQKKVARWQKLFMVLSIRGPSAKDNNGDGAWSTVSFFESESATVPLEFFRFLSKDCFKIKKYKPNEKYNGKPNVFKLRFFKKVINAYAKSRGDKGAKVKHSINLYIAFTSWKRCAKWQDRLKEVAEHVEKKSAFGDFLDDWDAMTVEEREAEACEIALSHLETAQDDVERALGFDFDELCNDAEEHKEALIQKAAEESAGRAAGGASGNTADKVAITSDTSQTAVFSLDDFGTIEIEEDNSAQDQVKAKLQHFLFRLTSSLIDKLLHDLREQFKDFSARSRIDVFLVFFNEYWKLAVRFLEAMNFDGDEDNSPKTGKYTTMPRHRKAQQPNAPGGSAVHESPIVDELLSVLVIPKEPFRAWGANDVLNIAGNLSALWLLFQTASVSGCRVEATRKIKGPAKSECFAVKAPATKERVSFANLGGEDNDSSGEDDDSDDDDANNSTSKAPSLYGTRGEQPGNPNYIRVDLWHLNAWIHFCVQLFLPRYKKYFVSACTNTANTVLGLNASGSGPKLENLKVNRNGTVGTTYPFDLTTIMYNQYTNLLKHNCLHVHGLVAGVIAIHGGGLLLIQQKFLDDYDDICEELMDLEANAAKSRRTSGDESDLSSHRSYLFFLVALVNDCLQCKDKVLHQKRVFDNSDANDNVDELPAGTSGGAKAALKASSTSPTSSPASRQIKTTKSQTVSATARLRSVVADYLSALYQDYEFPESFRQRSLLGGSRHRAANEQYQTLLEQDLQDISGEMISRFIHFLFDKTSRFPHFAMLGTKEAWVFDEDAKKLAAELEAAESAREAARRGEDAEAASSTDEFVQDLKEVGNDIKNAFDQFGKSDLIKKMEKGFKDFNLQLKQSKVGQTFTKTFEQIAESPEIKKMNAAIKRNQELTRKRLPLRRGPDPQSNCLKLALSELSAFYYGSIARKLDTGLVAYILPIIANRLTVAYLHGLQQAITHGHLRLRPCDVADDVDEDGNPVPRTATTPHPFISEDGRCCGLFHFVCDAADVRREVVMSFDAFETIIRGVPRRSIGARTFRDTLAGCLRPQVATSTALDQFLLESRIVPQSGLSTGVHGEADDFTFDFEAAMQSLRNMAQLFQDQEHSADAWKHKNVCGEVNRIDQALFGMALSSYGVEKAHRRYYQLVWPRLGVLDDWRCMLKAEVQRLGQCCDIALNRIAMGTSGANEEMHLGKSYADGVYLAAKSVILGREDCLCLDDDNMLMKDEIIANCYMKAQCLYSVNQSDEVVDSVLSLVQDDVYARIFPQTVSFEEGGETLPSEQKPLGESEREKEQRAAEEAARAATAAAAAAASAATAASAGSGGGGVDSRGAERIARQASAELKKVCRFNIRSCNEQHPVFQPSTRTYTIGCDFGKTSKTITRTYTQFAGFAATLAKELDLQPDERPPLPGKPDPFRRRSEADNIKEMQQFVNNVVANYFFEATFKFFDLDPDLK